MCNGIFIIIFSIQIASVLSDIRLIRQQNNTRLYFIQYDYYIENKILIEDYTSIIAYINTIAYDNNIYIHEFEMNPVTENIMQSRMTLLSDNINKLYDFLSNLPSQIYINSLTVEYDSRLVIDFFIVN